MSKYNTYQQHRELPSNREVHPVWRGIGCIIIILTPIISWAAASLLLEFGKLQKWPFLYELRDYIRFPEVVYQIPGVLRVAYFLSGIPYLKALLIFFVLMLIVFSGVFAVLNAVAYRIVGPPRYTRLDAPAPRVKTKKYTR